MDNNLLKKCVLLQHGVTINGNHLGTCCYNSHSPFGDTYQVDPIHCKVCIDQENNGIFSYRQGANQKYGFDHPRHSLLVLDVTPNINCNLACGICSEFSSSTWAKFKSIKIDSKINVSYRDLNTLVRNFDLSGLREINFSGGEPWLNNNIQRYIEPLEAHVDFSKVTLRFSTNGTQPMSSKLNNFFSKFQLVLARFSLDDIEQYHEYQRYPSKWNHWESNWKNSIVVFPSNTIPSINRTVSIFNIARLSQLEQWHSQFSFTASGDPIELIDHFAFGTYSLDFMPQLLREHVLTTQGEQSRAWSYIKNRKSSLNNKNLMNYINDQDRLRNTNLQNTDPLLYSLIFS